MQQVRIQILRQRSLDGGMAILLLDLMTTTCGLVAL